MAFPTIIPLDEFFEANPGIAPSFHLGPAAENRRRVPEDYREVLPYRPVVIFDSSLAIGIPKAQLIKQAKFMFESLDLRQHESTDKPLVFVAQRPQAASGRATNTPITSDIPPAPRAQINPAAQDKKLIDAVETNRVADVEQFLLKEGHPRLPPGTLSMLLHIAVKNGYHDMSSLLLRKDAPVDGRDKNGNTPLLAAAREGHEDIVRILLLFGAKLEAENEFKWTALHGACGHGHFGIVKHLLKKKADLKTLDHNGKSPLHLAVFEQRLTVVEVLLQYRAEPNMADKDGDYPLHVAARQGSTEIMKSLLEAGATPNPSPQLPSPLFIAVSHKQIEVLRLLLQHGAVATGVDDNKNTALHLAAKIGHAAAIGPLLEKGCSLKAKNASKKTALELSISGGSIPTVRNLLEAETKMAVNMATNNALLEAVKCENPEFLALFLRRGANVNLRDSSDSTLLHVAVQEQRSGNVALLLVHGAALDAKNSSKQTPLMLAIVQSLREMVKVLLAHDQKNINSPCVDGWRPLHFAAKENKPAVLVAILESGAYIEIKSKNDGLTTLHLAVESGCVEAVECLLKAGANPNACNKSGQTPLHKCTKKSLIDPLVRHGAKLEARADDGSTPLFLAARWGRSTIVEALASHKANLHTGLYRESTSPLIRAVINGHAKTVQVLLQYRVDVHQKLINGQSPIGLAASKGHTEVIKVLLEYRADIEASHGFLGTPLIMAVKNGRIAVVEMLLDRRAKIEATYPLGMRPLHHACDVDTENTAIVELLLKRRADVHARFTVEFTTVWEQRKCKTALHFAAMKGFYDTAKILLDYGADPMARNHLGKTARDLVVEYCPSKTALSDLLARRASGLW